MSPFPRSRTSNSSSGGPSFLPPQGSISPAHGFSDLRPLPYVGVGVTEKLRLSSVFPFKTEINHTFSLQGENCPSYWSRPKLRHRESPRVSSFLISTTSWCLGSTGGPTCRPPEVPRTSHLSSFVKPQRGGRPREVREDTGRFLP